MSRFRTHGNAITFDDNAVRFLNTLASESPKDFARAARYGAFMAQKRLKKEIRRGIVGGTKIPAQSFLTKSKRTRISGRFDGDPSRLFRKRRRFTGKMGERQSLVNSIGYQKFKTGARVGWLSGSASKWAQLAIDGWTRPVTPKMRRFLAAIGMPTKKSSISAPKVPVMRLFFNRRSKWIFLLIRKRIEENLKRVERRFAS